MSAITLTRPSPPRQSPSRSRPGLKRIVTTPALTTTATDERTPLLSSSSSSGNDHGGRTRPLRDTLSTPRFITICAGIFSANFAFAFQSTSVPTMMTGISSGYGHAELGSYLGSVFTLANTAGMIHPFTFRQIEGTMTDLCSDTGVRCPHGITRAQDRNAHCLLLLWTRHDPVRRLG